MYVISLCVTMIVAINEIILKAFLSWWLGWVRAIHSFFSQLLPVNVNRSDICHPLPYLLFRCIILFLLHRHRLVDVITPVVRFRELLFFSSFNEHFFFLSFFCHILINIFFFDIFYFSVFPTCLFFFFCGL